MKKAIVVLLLALLTVGTVFANGAKEQSPAQQVKDSLVIGVNHNYTTLTPFNRHAGMALAGWAIYEKLAYEADGTLTPWLAKEWSKIDGTHYKVTIWDCIYDTAGNHITAADVVFCYNMFKATSLPSSELIGDVKAIDDYTIEFTLASNTLNGFDSIMCLVCIVSQNAYEKSSDGMASQPISTAAFKVVDYVQSTYITLEKNENYWQKDESKIAAIAKSPYKSLKFINLAEPSTQTINLETGTVDAFDGIDESQVAYFSEGGQYADKFNTLLGGSAGTYGLFFSGTSTWMQDKNMRLAVYYALDLDGIAKASGSLSTVCEMLACPFFSDVVEYSKGNYNKYNPEKAKEYLKKAGYNGEKIRFLGMIACPTANTAIQYYLNQVGINIEASIPEGAVFAAQYKDYNSWDIAFCSHSGSSVANFWYKNYYSKTGTQKHGWTDAELIQAVYDLNVPENYSAENVEKVSRMFDERLYGIGLYTTGPCSVCSKETTPEHPFVLTRESAYYIPLWVE